MKKFKLLAGWDSSTASFKCTMPGLARRLLSGHTGGVLLEVQKVEEKRSNDANALYWGLLMPDICAFHKETQGESIDPMSMHLWICTHLMGIVPDVIEVFGQTVIKAERVRTSKMSKKKFSEFIDTVINHFEPLGCKFEKFYEYQRENEDNSV
jgi:hypothetical protein